MFIFFQDADLDDFVKVIFATLDNGMLLKALKNSKIELKDILSQYDTKLVIKNTLETVGTKKMLKLLQCCSETDSFTQEVETFCSKNVALKDIIKNHTVDNLKQALTDLIEANCFSRNDVIEHCLVPLVETPKDLHMYFNSLTVVDLGDIVIEKLLDEDSVEFVTKLSKACVNGAKDSLTVQLCKKDLLSSTNVVTCFKSCLIAKKEDEQTEIMVEMFKFISGRLNAETLLNLHVEFLQRIPSAFSSKHN